MRKYFVIIFLMVLEAGYTWSLQSITLADTPLAKELTINQIKLTGDEFIVLHNTTTNNLLLSDYWLQYFNDFDLGRTSSANSSQLPAVWLQPGQEILLAVGTAASCGPVWVSKLSFGLKDSAGMLQVLGIHQTGGIVGYQPEDQVSWSSKPGDPVDVRGVSSSASSQIYYKEADSWRSSATPPGCSAASSSTSPNTSTPDTLTQSSTSPPSVLMSQSEERANAGLMAPQISEILPNPGPPKTDANDEYIELYNPNDTEFDLSGYKLQTGANSTYSYTFPDGQSRLQPHEFRSYYSSATNLSLSNTTSEIRFLSPDNEVFGRADIYTDAPDDNSWILADGLWQWTSVATPNARNVISSSGNSSLGSNSAALPPATTAQQSYPTLVLSELLPNPKSPQNDTNDEFIEIYNPNKEAVNLAGYVLVTGSKDNHRYTIKDGSIEPGEYKIFSSSTTHLTLSNSDGRAKILAPNGSQIDATSDYTKAPEGQSWIYSGGKWQWTANPTPGKANIFSAPAAPGSNIANNRSQASNSPTSPTATTNKANPLHPLILAGIGGTVLLYALYEYRHDLANQLFRFRRNRTVGRASGQIAQTAGDGRTAL